MIISHLKGGLGNYLFQIAAGYSLAKQNNSEFAVDLSRVLNNYIIFPNQMHTHINVYLNNIFRNLKFVNNYPTQNFYKYESLTYKPIPFAENLYFEGYFQSEKYFYNDREVISNLFSIDDETYTYLNQKYKNILSEDTCGIHVRRGDYLRIDFFNKLSMDYYNNAIDTIGRDKHFLVFSNDIEWCKKNFSNIKVTFIENEKDYVDLYLMSLCKNVIIANSSFSWWAAFLNKTIDKKIVAPNIWFNSIHSNSDINAENWIKI